MAFLVDCIATILTRLTGFLASFVSKLSGLLFFGWGASQFTSSRRTFIVDCLVFPARLTGCLSGLLIIPAAPLVFITGWLECVVFQRYGLARHSHSPATFFAGAFFSVLRNDVVAFPGGHRRHSQRYMPGTVALVFMLTFEQLT